MTYKFLQKFLSKLLSWGSLALICQSCGYQSAVNHNALSGYSSITVPYVEGDEEGDITAQLVQALAEEGPWKYHALDAELSLKVKILEIKREDVGYDRFYNENGEIERWMVPNERRLSVRAQVVVIEEATQKNILGPMELSESVKLDFNPEYSETNLVRFSLAQYDFVENAERTAHRPLNQRLAKIIVNSLINSW